MYYICCMKITKDYLLGFTEGIIAEYSNNVYPIDACNTFYVEVNLINNDAEIIIGYSYEFDGYINVDKISVNENTTTNYLQREVIDLCIKIENYIRNGNN